MKKTLGRNDSCWCGSGKKYKSCHWRTDEVQRRETKAPKRMNKPGAPILNDEEREAMRKAGRFNAQLMDFIRPMVKSGVSTGELDRLIHEYTLDHGHTPACLGYMDYPKSSCISVNEVVCHGIPGPYELQEGDIVNVDITSIVEGWHGDQSETFLIGQVSPEARRLVQVTFDSLYLGIDAVRPNCRVADIGFAINRLAAEHGYGVVWQFQGHGLGRKFHQAPDIPHAPTPQAAATTLLPGMCFTIEPMISEGSPDVHIDKEDGWTVRTVDGRLSAQFEHTILLGEDGPEILTLTQNGPQKGHIF